AHAAVSSARSRSAIRRHGRILRRPAARIAFPPCFPVIGPWQLASRGLAMVSSFGGTAGARGRNEDVDGARIARRAREADRAFIPCRAAQIGCPPQRPTAAALALRAG